MAKELWRNLLDIAFNFQIADDWYWVEPRSYVAIPVEFHSIIGRRGYALEHVPDSFVDDDFNYLLVASEWTEKLDAGERIAEQVKIAEVLQASDVKLSGSEPKPKKKKSKKEQN